MAGKFFAAVVAQARAAHLMSHDHFTVDGTLIEAWASLKSFKRKDESAQDREPPDDPGNPTVNFRGEKRSNETHASTTDDEARLARKKGKESKLSYSAHALMENRNGLLVDFRIDQADGFAERRNALEMLADNVVGARRVTVGADKGYDTADFAHDCRALPSREDGEKLLRERLTSKVELEKLARVMDLPVDRRDNSERLREKIIESSIGSRLGSRAIRGEVDPSEEG